MNVHISTCNIKLTVAALIVEAGFGTAAVTTTLFGASPAAPAVSHGV